MARSTPKASKNKFDAPKAHERWFEEFSFIDFEKKKMKNCGESISFLAKSKEEFVKAVLTFFEVECRFKIDDCGTNY